MREVLYLGTKEGALEHLEHGAAFVRELAGRLGLDLTRAVADDPFYDKGGSRARLMALDPVKHEFSAPDGTAIASVNRHRNFFGERLDIRAGSGGPAYSACVAFGVERWVHAMVLAHGTPRGRSTACARPAPEAPYAHRARSTKRTAQSTKHSAQ